MRTDCFPTPRHHDGGSAQSRIVALAGALLFTLLFLGLPGAALASCCGNGSVGSSCCNVFGCNCDGPCTNFGCSPPPSSQNGSCGVLQNYDTCTPDGVNCKYCDPGYYACNNCANCCSTSAGVAQKEINTTKSSATLIALPTEVAVSAMERFKGIDTNGNGKITFEEARAWFKKNARGSLMSDKELRSTFDALDKNKNGTIEPDELDASLAKGAELKH